MSRNIVCIFITHGKHESTRYSFSLMGSICITVLLLVFIHTRSYFILRLGIYIQWNFLNTNQELFILWYFFMSMNIKILYHWDVIFAPISYYLVILFEIHPIVMIGLDRYKKLYDQMRHFNFKRAIFLFSLRNEKTYLAIIYDI